MAKWTGRNVMRLRKLIYTRDQGICGLCGQYAAYEDGHVDHITPRAHGGTNAARNLQWSHATCNLRKGVRGGATPLENAGKSRLFPFSLPADRLW